MLTYLVPIAVLGAASAAHANCALDLVGDPGAAAELRDALVGFGDDAATCVDLEVQCTRDAGELVLDLHDALGRSVVRRFRTADGAAAFVVSWSRRPLPQAGTGLDRIAPPNAPAVRTVYVAAAPGATAPGATAPRTPIDDGTWHQELRAAYMGAPFVDGWAAAAEIARIRRHGIWRYGGDLRAIGASLTPTYLPDGTWARMWLGLDAEATFGAAWTIDRLTLRAEIAAGGAFVSVVSSPANLHFQALGARGGVRAAAASQVMSALWFEVGIGWDALRQTGMITSSDMLGDDRNLSQAHLEIGLLWAP